MATLTVDFPDTTELPAELQSDPEEVRYLLVGTMLELGRISKDQARALTGDSPERLETKLRDYGFSKATAKEQDPAPSRWKAVADRFDREGFLDNRSDAALNLLANSRIAL